MPKIPHTDMHENVILRARSKTEGRYAISNAQVEHGPVTFEYTLLRHERVD